MWRRFCLRLALRFNRWDVDAFLAEIPAKQLMEWYQFDRIEPLVVESEYIGHGIVASTLANVNRDSKKKKDPFTVGDFIPTSFKSEVKKKQLTTKELAELQKQFFLARGGAQR